MTLHDDSISLRHMLDHVREATEMVRGRSREDLNQDRTLELALTRLVEIIGEAARRVSPKCRAHYPRIPWTHIIGMRDRLTHGYDVLNLDILWHVLVNDLPNLLAKLEEIVPSEESQ